MTINVLVVDDTAVARRLVVRAIEADPEIRALGTASSGQEALEILDGVVPDLVTLDLEMPGLDGLATLRLLRRKHPRLPVVVVSALSEPGARKALEALTLGANDFVTKPTRVASIEAGLDGLRNQLIPKIKALHGKSLRQQSRAAAMQAAPSPGSASAVGSAPAPVAHPHQVTQPAPLEARSPMLPAARQPVAAPTPGPVRARATAATRTPAPARNSYRARAAVAGPVPALPAARGIDVIAIGGSTGGPQALEALLRPLRADLPVPILLVQHMPPTFTRLLAERLDSVCALHVREAAEGDEVRPGEVLIAPGDLHLTPVRRGAGVVAHLDRRPPENHCRPAVDVLFRGVAEIYGARALAVVLTGMGTDGLLGSRVLREAGAPTVVQDEESSVVWGMAGAVASAGLAEQVLPLSALPNYLLDASRRHREPVASPRRAAV